MSEHADTLTRRGSPGTFPWHDQQLFALASATNVTAVLGGNQCLAGEQEVYDPVEGRMRRVRDVDGPWHVLAWDGERVVVAVAQPPYVRGVDRLYRYGFSGGLWLLADSSHRVLTEDASWRTIYGATSLALRESIWARIQPTHVSGGPHWTQTTINSMGRCPACLGYDGVPLPVGSSISLASAPSQAGVQTHSGCVSEHSDDRVTIREHTRLCPRCGHPSSSYDPDHFGALSVESEVPDALLAALLGGAANPSIPRPGAVEGALPQSGGAGLRLLDPLGSVSAASVSPLVVTKVDVWNSFGQLWDFGVPGYGNYIAGGVVNHNSGKTTAGAGVVSRLVRREGPIYRRLRNPESRPLKIWVSPQSFEKYKSNWERRLHDEVFAGLDITHHVEVGYKQTPVPVFTWDDGCAEGNQLWGKSQDQGFLAFESDVVDLIVFDEEPKDPRIYTSSVQRLATTNGIILLTFTPLLGMSWTHGRFYQPTVKPEYKVADRVWRRGNDVTIIEMGMADNPESVAGGGVARIQSDPGMTEAEKNTRLHGKYGYAEGLIFPEFATLRHDDADNPYLLDGLPSDRAYSWLLTCDPNKRHGGLLTSIDHEGNRFYVAEHYKEDQPDRLHAADYHKILRRFNLENDQGIVGPSVGIFADPGGAGAQAIINLADYGIFAGPVKKDAGSVKASIELVRRAAWIDPTHKHPVTGVLGAPHVYFMRSLRSTWRVGGVEYHESRLMWELRQYRQKDNSPPDTPIKELDDVVDPMRYLELVRPFSPIMVDRSSEIERIQLDRLSRKASTEFDDLVAKMKQPKKGRGDVW